MRRLKNHELVEISNYYALDQGFSTFFFCVCFSNPTSPPSQPFLSAYLLCDLRTFCIPLCNKFPYRGVLCVLLFSFCISLELFAYPIALKYRRLRNPALDKTFLSKGLRTALLSQFSTSKGEGPIWDNIK